MTAYELACAYGRDFKSAKAVREAWDAGKDFLGDYQLGFLPVSVQDIPLPCDVILRYARGTRFTLVKVRQRPAPKADHIAAQEGGAL